MPRRIGEELLRSIRQIRQAQFRLFRDDAARVGITGVQLYVISILERNENISLGELAERLNQSNSTVSGVIDRLVTAGLVVRERSKGDRRAIVLGLTEKGKEIFNQAYSDDSAMNKKLSKVEASFSEEELRGIIENNKKILAIFEENEE